VTCQARFLRRPMASTLLFFDLGRVLFLEFLVLVFVDDDDDDDDADEGEVLGVVEDEDSLRDFDFGLATVLVALFLAPRLSGVR
jgi:hypothetical protein